MGIIVVGLSHKTAPVEVREKFSFGGDKLDRALKLLGEWDGVVEGVILSTCNRVEVISYVKNAERGKDDILRFFSEFHGIDAVKHEEHFYCYSLRDAVNHVFRVTSSLDSMVIGEPQIMGQMKQAYSKALEYKTTKAILNHLFHKAFFAAKRVRNETDIGKNAVSISFAAVELAKKIFGSLENRDAMIIGAGEMSELVAKHLLSSGINNIYVINRTLSKAAELAREFNGEVIHYENLKSELHLADIVITSTGAPHFILYKDDVEKTIHKRKNNPIFLIDIAVPRDLDPKINDIDNVYLYDIDDLEAVIQSNLAERKKEAVAAQGIIDKEIGSFSSWLSGREMVPLIVRLRERMDGIRRKEVQKVMPKLKSVSDEDKQLIESLSTAIINKILHNPTMALRGIYEADNIDSYTEITKELFGLDKD